MSQESHAPDYLNLAWHTGAAVAGAFTFAAMQDGIPLRQRFTVVFIGGAFAVFLGPWVADVTTLTSDHARAGMTYLLGITGMTLARAIIRWTEKSADSSVGAIIGRLLGIPKPPDKP